MGIQLDAAAAAGEGHVVVFGANGFTGGDVIRSLLAKGIPVKAVSKFKDFKIADDQKNKELVSVHVGSVTRPDTYADLLKGARSIIYANDAQVDNAGTDREQIGTAEYDEIESKGVAAVAKVAIDNKVRVLDVM